jgi:hypothetical protein
LRILLLRSRLLDAADTNVGIWLKDTVMARVAYISVVLIAASCSRLAWI